MEERAIDQGIEGRCGAIRSFADDDSFTRSLDYYTTLRVRPGHPRGMPRPQFAYLRMNVQSLRDRLSSVGKTASALAECLGRAPPGMHTEWQPPPDVPAPLDECVEDGPQDPNAPCLPRLQDYFHPHQDGLRLSGAPTAGP